MVDGYKEEMVLDDIDEGADFHESPEAEPISRRRFFARAGATAVVTAGATLTAPTLSSCKKKKTPEARDKVELLNVNPPKFERTKKTKYEMPPVPDGVTEAQVDEIATTYAQAVKQFFLELKKTLTKDKIDIMAVYGNIKKLAKMFTTMADQKIPGYRKFLVENHPSALVSPYNFARLINMFLVRKNLYFYFAEQEIDLFGIEEAEDVKINEKHDTSLYVLDRGIMGFDITTSQGLAYNNCHNSVLIWRHKIVEVTDDTLEMVADGKGKLPKNRTRDAVYKQTLEDTIRHEITHMALIFEMQFLRDHKGALQLIATKKALGQLTKEQADKAREKVHQADKAIIQYDELTAIGSELAECKDPVRLVYYLSSRKPTYQLAVDRLKKAMFKLMIRDSFAMRVFKFKSSEGNISRQEVLIYYAYLIDRRPEVLLRLMNSAGLKMYREGYSQFAHADKN